MWRIDDIEWCRDERCPIEGLHPAHEIEVPTKRGRPRGSIRGCKKERKARIRWRDERADWTCPVCQGRGWVDDVMRGCDVCFGRGKLTFGMRCLEARRGVE